MTGVAESERRSNADITDTDDEDQAHEQERLQALGGLVISAAALESTLRLTLGVLQRLPASEIPGGGKTAGALIDANRRQLAVGRRVVDDHVKQQTGAALDRCEAVNKERNRAIHDAWAFADDGSVVQINSKYGESRVVTPADLIAIDHNIQACIIELFDGALAMSGLTRETFAAKLKAARAVTDQQ